MSKIYLPTGKNAEEVQKTEADIRSKIILHNNVYLILQRTLEIVSVLKKVHTKSVLIEPIVME